MRSRVIVFPEPGRVEVIEEQVGPPGPGEVTIESHLSLVSTGTELICLRGECDPDTHWRPYASPPHHPGYSVMGRVRAVGEGVEDIREGARVCATMSHRDLANRDAGALWCPRVPDDMNDEQAVWAILGVITQTGVRQAEHVLGDRAVVVGLGPLGQLVTQYLRAMGLREVMVIDQVQQRVDAALVHGATAGICGDVAEAGDFVAEHTAGRLADVVYDVTGHWAVLPQALPLARDHGTLVLLGDSPFPSRQHLTYDVLSRQVSIVGSRSSWLPPQHSFWTPREQTDLLFTYLRRGAMRVEDLITHRFPPEDAPEVYRTLLQDRERTLGVVYDWQGG
ncbi:MAG: zinc-binding dehydrogenase [Armatimonadota bacterium]